MARRSMPPQERYRNHQAGLRMTAPDGARSSNAHHPDVPSVISFPTHPPAVPERKLGLMATIGKTRFLVLMMMVLPLALGTWVVFNSRLYDVSFVFDRDGRVKIKRKTLPGSAPTSSAPVASSVLPVPTIIAPSAPSTSTTTRVMADQKRSGRHIKLKPSREQGVRVSGGGGSRTRERRTPTKPIPTRKKQVALVPAKRKVVDTTGPSQGGFLGLFTGIRVKKSSSSEPEVSVVELRLGVRQRQKSQATRGVVMRQTSIRTKRKEEWNRQVKQKSADRRAAVQREKLDKKAAKIEAKQAKIDDKRFNADARQYELDLRWQAKEDATMAKSTNRAETSIGRALKKKVQIEYRLWHEKRDEQKAHRCSEYVDEAREAEGIWRSIRVRRRSAAEKACLAGKKSFLGPAVAQVGESVSSLFRAIRLRRRQPKYGKQQSSSAPTEVSKKAPPPAHKQKAYKKGAPPRRYASPTSASDVDLSPSFSPLQGGAYDDSLEDLTMMGYLSSIGFSRNRRSRRDQPFEEDDTPDTVLGHFFGKPSPPQYAAIQGSGNKKPSSKPPAIRIRRTQKRRY